MRLFFFAVESPRPLALVRCLLGLVLLCDALLHWRYSVELYSTFGPAMPIFLKQAEEAADVPPSGDPSLPRHIARVQPLNPFLIPAPGLAVGAHTLLVFSLGCVTIGWHTRASLAAAFVLTLWLAPLDLPGTFGKHYVLAIHLLLLLGFSRCGSAWSFDAAAEQHGTHSHRLDSCRLSSAGPRRLIQILICSVYAGAAITKIKTPAFVNGDLVTFSLLDDRWGGGRFAMWLTTVRHVPLLLSQATLLFEILFPILIWVPRCRPTLIATALAVHASMGCLLNLGPFSPIVFAALFSFLEERDLALFGRSLRCFTLRAKARESGPTHATATIRKMPNILGNAGLHFAFAILFVACGVGIQYAYDWHGAFGRKRRELMVEIPSGEVSEMLTRQSPAHEDYFHRVELGSRFGGNQVFGSPTKFRVGQRAYVLTQMPMPHPAVKLEGLLISPGGRDGLASREVARFTHQFDSGFSYSVNGFELTPELPLGTYRVVLRADGFVVAERRFDLEP